MSATSASSNTGSASAALRGWKTWLCAALALNAALLLVRAGQRCFASKLDALAATITDDSYYYLLPAFRFHEHGFWTFDGEHPTFGVQPVYAWFLTGLAAFFDERASFFRAALWTNYVCFVATAVWIGALLYRVLKPCGAFRAGLAAVLGAHGFLLNLTLVHGYTTLKENSLYALLLIASLWLAHRASAQPTRRALLAFGFVTGLAIGCRITPSTLAVAATAALFAAGGPRGGRLLAIAGGLAAAVLPWVVHAWLTFGRVLPTSGALKMTQFSEALRDGTLDERLPALLGQVGPYLVDVLAYSLGLPNAFGVPQGQPVPSALTLVFPCLLLGLLFACARGHALRSCPGALLVPASILAAILGTALNPLLLGLERMDEVRRYYTWYIADLPVLLAVLAPLAVSFRVAPGSVLARSERTGAWLSAALAAGLALAGVFALGQVRVLREFRQQPGSWNTQMVAIAARANEHLDAHDRIAAYNAGVIGFLARAAVVNMDGLANDDVLGARARGLTNLEYLQQNHVGYLIDPLRAQGWFGNPFDRVELVEAVPFHLDVPPEERTYHDGYFLLRLVEERFPGFEPLVEGDGVRVVPWLPEDPLGGQARAVRCFRFEPVDGAATAVFHTLRTFSALRFRRGVEGAAAAQDPPTLTIRDEAGRELHRSAVGRPESLTIPCAGADWIRVEVTSSAARPGTVPITWLTDVSFTSESRASAPAVEQAFEAYGSGCCPDASAGAVLPQLTAEGEASPGGALRFTCSNAPPGATGTLAIGVAPARMPIEGGCTGLVERTSATILLQLHTDEHGRSVLPVTIPADIEPGHAYAQVVFRDPADSRRFLATTNGLRILLAE